MAAVSGFDNFSVAVISLIAENLCEIMPLQDFLWVVEIGAYVYLSPGCYCLAQNILVRNQFLDIPNFYRR